MPTNTVSPAEFFSSDRQEAELSLIACPGAEVLTQQIDSHLVNWAREAGIQVDSFIAPVDCPRFQSGDAKGLVKRSVRGHDVFLVVDPGNYSLTYNLFGNINHMSPDDHYANLKRLIQAVAGRAHRVSVIMPSLYGGRQHRRINRESLDCAVALQELQAMGVQNIITFDAHDPRVVNAVPLMSFDNVMPTYQVLKTLLKHRPDLNFQKDHFMVISPDEGAMSRNMYFSSVLGCNLGMFYKRRDYSRVVNGRNPIVAHEYLGESVEGKTVFIADDIIASGESMLEVAGELKKRGAAHIICNATFPLFTSGLQKFDEAVANGTLTAVLGTNLTYRSPELLEREWYFDVDCSKYTAYFVAAINHDMSVSALCDPIKKIDALLQKHQSPANV
jgi:ribose-phosphate pyrophosphokinase